MVAEHVAEEERDAAAEKRPEPVVADGERRLPDEVEREGGPVGLDGERPLGRQADAGLLEQREDGPGPFLSRWQHSGVHAGGHADQRSPRHLFLARENVHVVVRILERAEHEPIGRRRDREGGALGCDAAHSAVQSASPLIGRRAAAIAPGTIRRRRGSLLRLLPPRGRSRAAQLIDEVATRCAGG